MRPAEQASLIVTFGMVGLPSLFLARAQWVLASVCALALIIAYLLTPVFHRYRKNVKGFSNFVLVINIVGVVVGLVIYSRPSWDIGMVFLWLFAWLVAGYPIVKRIDAL